MYKSTVK